MWTLHRKGVVLTKIKHFIVSKVLNIALIRIVVRCYHISNTSERPGVDNNKHKASIVTYWVQETLKDLLIPDGNEIFFHLMGIFLEMSINFSYINRGKLSRWRSFLSELYEAGSSFVMESTVSIIFRIVAGLLLITQTFICALALKKIRNVDEFSVENQRSRRRDNYVTKKRMDEGMLVNDDDFSLTYSTDYFDTESNPEELPSMMVDYANMIRNDIILLDNSVETRTRKRGNIKVEKHNKEALHAPNLKSDFRYDESIHKRNPLKQAITDEPCNCATENKHNERIYLGEEYFPRFIESKTCSKRLCPSSFSCQRSFYNISILKRAVSSYPNEISQVEVPHELRHRWIGIKRPITIGCTCTRNYVERN